MSQAVQHVFLIGAKGLGEYGGYETFVNKLTEYHRNNKKIKYHVACKANGDGCMDESKLDDIQHRLDDGFIYHNAHCFTLHVAEIGSAQALLYDIAALRYCCKFIKEYHIWQPTVYIMACRIGPVMRRYYRKIHKLGGQIYLNPDGHEWLRAKWSAPIRWYWKKSEKMMVKNSDMVVCDSKTIETYIHESYDGKGIHRADPETTFIAYGAETRKSHLSDEDPVWVQWRREHATDPGNYYLAVGRFVPEKNYETMIREFMNSDTQKDFVIITNQNKKLFDELERKLHFQSDGRIKFCGTVYDQELLMKIRGNAYGYIHGHEVGGTNPSLLEALGSTDLNLLLDVGFNREVAEDAAIYWTKEPGNLSRIIGTADALTTEEVLEYGEKAKKRIQEFYSWESISDKYEQILIRK